MIDTGSVQGRWKLSGQTRGMSATFLHFRSCGIIAYIGSAELSRDAFLSILLRDGILFANTRKFVEYDDKTSKEATIVLFVICNDVFAWACADSESLTVEDLPELIDFIKPILPGVR